MPSILLLFQFSLLSILLVISGAIGIGTLFYSIKLQKAQKHYSVSLPFLPIAFMRIIMLVTIFSLAYISSLIILTGIKARIF